MARVRPVYSIILPLLTGLALIALAGPRFLSGIPLSDPDPVMRALAERQAVAPEMLSRAARLRLRSLAMVSSGQTSYEVGLIRLHMALNREAGDPERGQLLAEASNDTRASLGDNPAQPFAWTQLTQLTLLRNGEAGMRAAASYYTMAVRTGPETPELVLPRVELGLVLWPRLDDAGRTQARQQIRLLAHTAPDQLALAARRRLALREARAALRDAPGLLERFDSAYRRLRQTGS